ncbi:MAG: hypothetical protein KY460_05800 [Actinobacteria bacterium]|nr:hypothetical protein [Actinomycetota bacterium]
MPVPPLFARLVDDAGLFPPERLPMRDALARHRADTARSHPVLTHRFLCPASRLAELRAGWPDPRESVRVGLIVDTGFAGLSAALDEIAADPRLRLETVEIALPAADAAQAARTHVPALARVEAEVFVEIPRTAAWREALAVVAAAGVGAKVRCGGVRAELFPTRAELAAVVVTAVSAGVACKATAGLHHAVRYRDPATGFGHHGFVNLLVATCRAVRQASAADVEAALEIDDAAVLADEARAVADPVARTARRTLVAYGSCSTREPIADLAALALI